MQFNINIAGVLTISITTIFSFIIWLLKRKRDFKRLYNGVKNRTANKAESGTMVSKQYDKKAFKLRYNFYQKLIKLLIKDIKEKYLVKVFGEGVVDYLTIVKEILDFINGKKPEV